MNGLLSTLKKNKHIRKLCERKMGTSIDLCRHVDHSFFLSQSSVNLLIMLNVSGYYLATPRGVGCQNSSEIYLNCHLAAAASLVPPRGFVHSLVWLHRLWLHCCQVSQGKLDGTPGVLEEEGGHWRTYCWPGDLGDTTGRADRFPPGCCTDSKWPPGCLQAPAAPDKGRKLVN